MKRRPCHILWKAPSDFDRYPWPRRGSVWLAGILVDDGAGMELATLYRDDSNRFAFHTLEHGAFDPYTVKRWAVVKPPYSPNC